MTDADRPSEPTPTPLPHDGCEAVEQGDEADEAEHNAASQLNSVFAKHAY